jgi:excisionase family DNA binding protein
MARAARSSSAEITTATAARILKVSHDTIARLCEEGRLRARRLRPRGWWRIEYGSLLEYSSRIRNR